MNDKIDLKKEKRNFILKVFIGIVMIGVGISMWYDFYQLETGAVTELRASSRLITLYNLVGKWGILLFMSVVGIAISIKGKIDFDKAKKAIQE